MESPHLRKQCAKSATHHQEQVGGKGVVPRMAAHPATGNTMWRGEIE
jgi:hypothetical protein